jgi:lysyl-tRNA synthetase class 2
VIPLAPLSPCDLHATRDGDAITVGGRITSNHGDALVLADALDACFVQMAKPTSLPEGTLVVVAATRRSPGLVDGAIVWSAPSSTVVPQEHQRLLSRRVGRNLRARSRMFDAVREFFRERGFIEVDTPQRVPSPGLDLHLDAFDADGAYLITSPEYQMKRLLAGGLPRIFQIVHCFRQGERGIYHNPEFAMLEWYRAFSAMDDMIDDTTHLIAQVTHALSGSSYLKLANRTIDVSAPCEQLTVLEAFARFAGVTRSDVLRWAEHDEDRYFRVLVDQVEPALASIDRLVVLRDYPASQASLARVRPNDPSVCERFEMYAGGVELCNGFGELTDPVEQRLRLEADQRKRKETGRPVYPIDEAFLAALQQGMPPSSGNALGLDRLLCLCLGTDGIGEVMAFPSELL